MLLGAFFPFYGALSDILTAIGANYVCRQGKIRDRAITRCAGKVEQYVPPRISRAKTLASA